MLLLLTSFLTFVSSQVPLSDFIPVTNGWDGTFTKKSTINHSETPVAVSPPFPFQQQNFDNIYVAINGGVCLTQTGDNSCNLWGDISNFPYPVDNSLTSRVDGPRNIISPFWRSFSGSCTNGHTDCGLYCKKIEAGDSLYMTSFNQIRSIINNNSYTPNWVLVMTWYKMPINTFGAGFTFANAASTSYTFQLVLSTDGTNSCIIYNFNEIDNNQLDGLAGWQSRSLNTNAITNSFNLPGSSNIGLLTNTNTGQNGQFSYDVSGSSTGKTGGDVHFTTLDGLIYTFNSAGDYIYLKSDKFECHVRTIMVGQTTSVLAALALKDNITSNILEIWWSGISSNNLNINYRQNGKSKNTLIELQNGRFEYYPFRFYHDNTTDKNTKKLLIERDNWQNFQLVITYNGRSAFNFQLDKSYKTIGLGGNNNGNIKDDLCNRRGNLCLNTNEVTSKQIHELFALDWKVVKEELLFEKWMKTYKHELKYHNLSSYNFTEYNDAKNICGEHKLCIYDYLNTKSKEFAQFTQQDFINMNNYVLVGDDISNIYS